MTSRLKKWLAHELIDLERMYTDSQYTPEQIMQVLPGRSWKAIVHVAQRQGFRRKRSDTWTPDERIILETMYTNAECSREQITQHLPGRSWRSIQCQANTYNLRRPQPDPPWTEEELVILRNVYPDSQYTPEDITGALPKRSWFAIRTRAADLNLRRPYRNPHQIDRRYFAQIDTPHKAYDLGLIAADGCISDRGHISLWLNKKDLQLVTQVRDRIAPGMSIHENKHAYGVSIGSQQMASDLARFGIVPRKTHKLSWPGELPEAYIVFFLLGYFDGDGSFHRYIKDGVRVYWRWSLVGTQSFLSAAHYHVQRLAEVKISEPYVHNKQSPNLYVICTTGRKAMVIDRTLNASGLGLPRKHLPSDT